MIVLLLTVRFVLELCALAALGYWGFHAFEGWGLRVLCGLGAPFTGALVWGLFVAPKAKVRLPWVARFAVELTVFAAACAALFAAGKPTLAAWLAGAELVFGGIHFALTRKGPIDPMRRRAEAASHKMGA